MSSKYEIVNGRLEVRGYTELFEKREVSSASTTTGSEAAVKMCPRCGTTYTSDQLRDAADYTGTSVDDVQCVDCDGVKLVDVDDDQDDDRSGRKPGDPDIS